MKIESHEALIGSEGRRGTLILGQISRLGLIPGRGNLVGQSQDSQRRLTVAQDTRQSLESSSKVDLKKKFPGSKVSHRSTVKSSLSQVFPKGRRESL